MSWLSKLGNGAVKQVGYVLAWYLGVCQGGVRFVVVKYIRYKVVQVR